MTVEVLSDAIQVPWRLLRAWEASLSEVEFQVALALIVETGRDQQIAAPCPMARLVRYWDALKRPVSTGEIEQALKHMVALDVLIPYPPADGESESPGAPSYIVNRDWPELPPRNKP